jgi:nucleoside-diphosphate-sugar epimerase
MQIAVTGSTGFIGRHILRQLVEDGHEIRAWRRPNSDTSGLEDLEDAITWCQGSLGTQQDAESLVDGCQAVVHAAFDRPGKGFRGETGQILEFCQANLMGSLQLIKAAQDIEVQRFVFISSCAVHDRILDDRPLDESHPTWASNHYGAYKAAVEQFVSSFGFGDQFPICALRPTGVYGASYPIESSKWFDLVARVVRGEKVVCQGGGKEVHVADVAAAVSVLLQADVDAIRGQAFNCYDQYVSQYQVAEIAKRACHSNSVIEGAVTSPKHQIETGKLKGLGMQFGGRERLEQTIQQMVAAAGLTART